MHKHSLWDISVFTSKMPYYLDIFEELKQAIYDYDKTVQEPLHPLAPIDPETGIGPWPQRHKKKLRESDGWLFGNTDNQYIKAVENFCGQSLSETLDKSIGHLYGRPDTYNIYFDNSWYHITKNGGYHDIHNHGNTSWAGIFYVDIGESTMYNANGVNRFYRPFDLNAIVGMEHLVTAAKDVTPENGKLVIFPGFLKHSGMPYYGTKDRIVISFNASVEVPDDHKLVGRSNPEGEQE